jgi:hypothetical protein
VHQKKGDFALILKRCIHDTSLLRQEVLKDFFPKISFFAKFAPKKQVFCNKMFPFAYNSSVPF